jgi:hypothetical protein
MDESSIRELLKEKEGLGEGEVDERIEIMKENLPNIEGMCICSDCPSYNGESELGFCHAMVGKSDVISEVTSCICRICPVTEMMGLKNDSFCKKGSEMEQF